MSQTDLNNSKSNISRDNEQIDLMALLLTIFKGWKTILAMALLGLLLGVTYSRYEQPTYKTDALVQIDSASKSISALGANISELVGTESTPADTERELIKSRMVLQPVIEKLQLDIRLSNPEIRSVDRILQDKIPTQFSTGKEVILDTKYGDVKVSSFNVPLAYLNKSFTLNKTATGFKLSHFINEQLVE